MQDKLILGASFLPTLLPNKWGSSEHKPLFLGNSVNQVFKFPFHKDSVKPE